jgi:transcriptional regulator with XRE-family HTH domain
MTLKDEKVKEIQSLRREGYTLREIAKRCGVSLSSVCRYSQDIIPDRDYLELKIKDMKDTMENMRGMITLMIAEREKCQKIQSELTITMLGCKGAIKSLQDAKDKAISEMKEQRDAVLGDLPDKLERLNSLANACLTAVNDITRFENGLRGMIADLTAFQKTIRDERLANVIGGLIDILFRGLESMLPQDRGMKIGGIGRIVK